MKHLKKRKTIKSPCPQKNNKNKAEKNVKPPIYKEEVYDSYSEAYYKMMKNQEKEEKLKKQEEEKRREEIKASVKKNLQNDLGKEF